ncbi:hypothetical protein [Pseudomonas gingeri]|uniref:hypothetical protein n=1 Tax=Pseudomonas gingeri TaxID=117681 RepID=UPI00210BDF8A|nr:hypothetical protein [Pseudomonas gingeri]
MEALALSYSDAVSTAIGKPEKNHEKTDRDNCPVQSFFRIGLCCKTTGLQSGGNFKD